jgi:hypothetical protein
MKTTLTKITGINTTAVEILAAGTAVILSDIKIHVSDGFGGHTARQQFDSFDAIAHNQAVATRNAAPRSGFKSARDSKNARPAQPIIGGALLGLRERMFGATR